VVKSCSSADSIALAFSHVQDAAISKLATTTVTLIGFKTHQKDGCHRHKSRRARACSRWRTVHRCIDQRDELLEIELVTLLLGRQHSSRNIRHEHRGPDTAFSVEDLLQVQWRALSLPHEHLAWAAQTQPPSWEVLQQVLDGWTILTNV